MAAEATAVVGATAIHCFETAAVRKIIYFHTPDLNRCATACRARNWQPITRGHFHVETPFNSRSEQMCIGPCSDRVLGVLGDPVTNDQVMWSYLAQKCILT